MSDASGSSESEITIEDSGSGQEPRPAEVRDRPDGDRDAVGQQHHRRLAAGGHLGEGRRGRAPSGLRGRWSGSGRGAGPARPRRPSSPGPSAPPTMAVDRNAQKVQAGPIQAPTPAISLTSPAPMPPMAYSGIRHASPTAAPASDQPSSGAPPLQYAYAQPPSGEVQRQPVGDPQRAAVDDRRLDEHERNQVRDLPRDLGHGRLLSSRHDGRAGPIPGPTATPGRPGITRASNRNLCRFAEAVKSERPATREGAAAEKTRPGSAHRRRGRATARIEPPASRAAARSRRPLAPGGERAHVPVSLGVGAETVVRRRGIGEVASDRPVRSRPGRPPRWPSVGRAGRAGEPR